MRISRSVLGDTKRGPRRVNCQLREVLLLFWPILVRS